MKGSIRYLLTLYNEKQPLHMNQDILFFKFLGILFCKIRFMQAIVKYCGGKSILKV